MNFQTPNPTYSCWDLQLLEFLIKKKPHPVHQTAFYLNNDEYSNQKATKVTVTLGKKTLILKQGISKCGLLQSPVFHVLNFTGWIKLIFDIVDLCNFVIKEFNLTFTLEQSWNGPLLNTSFEMPHFQIRVFEIKVTVASGHRGLLVQTRFIVLH